jgi:cytoskeletal protein CcmA (bactofilin family)
MFKKRRGQELTIVGRGARFEGTMSVQGPLRVDGEVDGDVLSVTTVSIGPDGRVMGSIRAGDLEIAGLVDGTVTTAGCLHMLATGRINGDAYYQTMQVDCGGVIDGRAKCVEVTDDALPESTDHEEEEEEEDDDEELSVEGGSPLAESDLDDEDSHPSPAVLSEGDQSIEMLHTGEFTELPDMRGETESSGNAEL